MPRKRKEGKELIGGYIDGKLKRLFEEAAKRAGKDNTELITELIIEEF